MVMAPKLKDKTNYMMWQAPYALLETI